MPLEVRNLGAGQEDILTSTGSSLLLLDLELHDVRGVLDDLVDVSPVSGTNLTQDTFEDPDDTANKPVTLKVINLASFRYHVMAP